MAYTVQAESFQDFMIRERSQLRSAQLSGAATISLVSTETFEVGDAIYVGELSREGCERARVSAVVDETTIDLSEPLKIEHAAYSNVTAAYADTIRIYRAPAKAGPFAQLVDRAIDADDYSTYYRDPEGSEAYWYRYTYVSADGTWESQASTPIQGSSFAHYCSLREVREEAGFLTNTNLRDTAVAQARMKAQDETNAALAGIFSGKVPFDPVPPIIHTLTIQLAAAHLLEYAYPGERSRYDERFKAARRQLIDLQNRDATIADDDGNDLSSSGISYYPNGDEPRMFSVSQRF